MDRGISIKKILLCITGSIAAVRSYELIRVFQDEGYEVQCVVTKGGEKFISRLALESLSGYRVLGPDVFTFEYDEDPRKNITKELYAHIEVSKDVEGIVIAPCSADTMSDIAHGKANDFLLSLLLANTKPVLIAPAMNTNMWENISVQENKKTLAKRGYVFCNPQKNGVLACRDEGAGKMAELCDIFLCYTRMVSPSPLAGKTMLINTGGTKEYFDPVRYIGNEASGMTGKIFAETCFILGAKKIQVVAGNSRVTFSSSLYETVHVQTTKEMKDAMNACFDASDIIIFSAAVADFTPEMYSETKIKKTKNENNLRLSLKKNIDIAAYFLQKKKPSQCFIGFALETEKNETLLKKIIIKKAERKGFDIVLGNSPQSFSSKSADFLVYREKDKQWEVQQGEKHSIFTSVLLSVCNDN